MARSAMPRTALRRAQGKPRTAQISRSTNQFKITTSFLFCTVLCIVLLYMPPYSPRLRIDCVLVRVK